MFGQSFGDLPDRASQMSSHHRDFVTQAVAAAQEGR